jgi:DNA-directed RNA polymerase specialized sigma24 family protein
MSVLEESLGGTEAKLNRISSTGWNRVLEKLDLDSLTPRSRSVSILIGEELMDGYKLKEIAERLGQPASWVSQRLEELRAEIALGADRFLPLTFTEYESLTESIKEYGVQTPILIGEHQLIDGRHRFLISKSLGYTEIRAEFVFGLTAEQEADIAVAVNSARRHLNRRQKRMLIRAQLKKDWSRSSRQIAAICGVTSPTVEDVRSEMRREAILAEQGEEGAEHFTPPDPDQDVRIDAQGRVKSAYVEGRHPPEAGERFMGYGVCAHGEMHAIYKLGENYLLKRDDDRDR